MEILTTLMRRAYRRPVTPADHGVGAGFLSGGADAKELFRTESNSRCGEF
jgi:hypothetical protein